MSASPNKPMFFDRVPGWFPVAALAAIVLVATAPIWRGHLLYGHSADIDLMRLVVFDGAIRAGDLFPRWVPDYYFGFGSPIFHFYGPLPFYLAEAFVLLGASFTVALKGALVVAWLATAGFMYLAARDYLSRAASFAAAVLYVLAPYHLVDTLVRHAFGEYIAFAWLPLAVWGIVGGIRYPGPARFVAGAVAVAVLPLTHNITALIFMPVLAALWTLEAWPSRDIKSAAISAGATLAGLGLACFFWLPAFVEKSLVFAEESLTQEYFRYADHFVYFHQFFDPRWSFGGSRVGWRDDTMSFQIGLVHWVLVLAAIFALSWRRRRDPSAREELQDKVAPFAASLGVFAVAVFMAHHISKALWDALPLLAFVQFPWRFLTIAAFGSSLAAGFAVDFLEQTGRARMRWVNAGVVLVCVAAMYGTFLAPRFYVHEKSTDTLHNGPIGEVREWMTSDDFEDVEAVATLDYVRASGRNGTSRDDYLPRTVEIKPPHQAPAIIGVGGGAAREVKRTGPNRYEARVSVEPGGGEVILNQFYYPGWRAWIDGWPATAVPEPSKGRVTLAVPAGEHDVVFDFGSTPLRTAANVVSWLSLMLVIGVFAVWRRRKGYAISEPRA
ncbi:hypothetical protein KDL45_06475 [bacterium]|nr:hypothetical protein [bacterium]